MKRKRQIESSTALNSKTLEALFDHVYSKHVESSHHKHRDHTQPALCSSSPYIAKYVGFLGDHSTQGTLAIRSLLVARDTNGFNRRRQRLQRQKSATISLNEEQPRLEDGQFREFLAEVDLRNGESSPDTLAFAFEQAMSYLRNEVQIEKVDHFQSAISSGNRRSSSSSPDVFNSEAALSRNATNPAYEFSDEE